MDYVLYLIFIHPYLLNVEKTYSIFAYVYINIFFHYCFSFFLLLIYSHMHTLFVSFLPPSPVSPFPLHFKADPVLPLPLILLKRRHKHNKEGKEFLLVELRIVIQKDS
jgi:hypothetical protein